jgi:hypothetical protein
MLRWWTAQWRFPTVDSEKKKALGIWPLGAPAGNPTDGRGRRSGTGTRQHSLAEVLLASSVFCRPHVARLATHHENLGRLFPNRQ